MSRVKDCVSCPGFNAQLFLQLLAIGILVNVVLVYTKPSDFAFTLAVEFVQIANLVMNPVVASYLYIDVLALRGSAFPCIMPLAPLNAVALRGFMPLFLFALLALMMLVEFVVRNRLGRLDKEVVVMRYVSAFWTLLLTCFSCT
jgi:hypothetical protein